MQLLPPGPGKCRFCAVDHESNAPHNAQSMYYQMRFKMEHGRDGTWADAIAHLGVEAQLLVRNMLEQKNAWTQPPDGVEPISELLDDDTA